MHPGHQLLRAHAQLRDAGGLSRASHWRIHAKDYAVLQKALHVGEHLIGLPLRVSDDPGLLGAGPLLAAKGARER